MKEFVLADNSYQCNEKHIDILIGADYYWDLVTGEVRKENCGLTLINSVFGYLLSGPVSVVIIKPNNSSSNFVSSQTLKTSCENREDRLLTEEVKKLLEIRKHWHQ